MFVPETEDQGSETVKQTRVVIHEIPSGETCVGKTILKEFGEGLFKGNVTTAIKNRGRFLYHVVYEDGDEEDLNDREFREAYELFHKSGNEAVKTITEPNYLDDSQEIHDEPLHSGGETEGSEFAPSDDEAHKIRRKTKRQKPKSLAKEKEKTKRRKTSKEVETKGRKQNNPGIDVEAILLTGSKDNITNKTVALMTEAEQVSLTTTAGKTILQQAKKGLRVQAFKVTL